MLIASGYNLLRRARRRRRSSPPPRALGGLPARRSSRSSTRASRRPSCTRTSTWSRRSRVRARTHRAHLPVPRHDPARRTRHSGGRDIMDRIVPARAGRSAPRRPATASPRCPTATPAARLPRADRRPARPRDRRRRPGASAAARALRIGVRTVWAYRRPTATSPTSAAARASRGRPRSRSRGDPRAPRPAGGATTAHVPRRRRPRVARLAAVHPIGPGGMAIVPSANGPATIPAIDDYAERGRLQRPHADRPGLGRGGRPERLPVRRDPREPAARRRAAPVRGRAFATVRSGRVWMAVKQSRSRRTAAPPSGSAR